MDWLKGLKVIFFFFFKVLFVFFFDFECSAVSGKSVCVKTFGEDLKKHWLTEASKSGRTPGLGQTVLSYTITHFLHIFPYYCCSSNKKKIMNTDFPINHN